MTENRLESENKKDIAYARLRVNVTTACGIVPLKEASVSVTYNAPPSAQDDQVQTLFTDETGQTKLFYMKIRRVKLAEREITLPRRAKCNITVSADGYVPVTAREVPVFPDITVIRSFDLMPKNKKTADIDLSK